MPDDVAPPASVPADRRGDRAGMVSCGRVDHIERTCRCRTGARCAATRSGGDGRLARLCRTRAADPYRKPRAEHGRPSCRERGCQEVYVTGVAETLKKKQTYNTYTTQSK